jgi:hypothetical protein
LTSPGAYTTSRPTPTAVAHADRPDRRPPRHDHAPLAPPDRRAFLAAVADALQGVAEIGDGLVSRVCAEQQRRWFTLPAEEGFGARGRARW